MTFFVTNGWIIFPNCCCTIPFGESLASSTVRFTFQIKSKVFLYFRCNGIIPYANLLCGEPYLSKLLSPFFLMLIGNDALRFFNFFPSCSSKYFRKHLVSKTTKISFTVASSILFFTSFNLSKRILSVKACLFSTETEVTVFNFNEVCGSGRPKTANIPPKTPCRKILAARILGTRCRGLLSFGRMLSSALVKVGSSLPESVLLGISSANDCGSINRYRISICDIPSPIT
mmetsp:Transcript_16053/g.18163  ORF Transcript_16053/g.18163 Transcript_16053/m.18163 type:complete len:230 (+) Transcript_16053:390-1079(+)